MTEERVSRQQRRAQERARYKQAKRTALTLGAALAAVPAAHAAPFTVSNLNDAGPGSLRQAIEDANGLAGADTIGFQAGLTGTITLTTGQLEITDSVDIQGPGRDRSRSAATMPAGCSISTTAARCSTSRSPG